MISPQTAGTPRPPTSESDLDASLSALRDRCDEWVRLPVERKVKYVEGLIHRSAKVAADQVAAALSAKGIPEDSWLSAEEWLAGPVCQIRNLRLLHESLESIAQEGAVHIEERFVRARPDGQVVVQVFPFTFLDALLHTDFTAEVWLDPSIRKETWRDHVASLYRGEAPPGKVALVLGAGNVSSIGTLDAVHKLFSEGQVVLLKFNPVNEYLGPFVEEVFEELIRDGYFQVAYGGAAVGEYLCQHAQVDEIHITGSAATHDVIVYGPGEEGAERKARNDPRLKKRISSELGNVSPVILVPGDWSAKQLRFHAENVATQMMQNCGFNCNAAKVVVLHDAWPQREAFMRELRAVLRDLPSRPAYYPGAEDRFARFVEAHPTAEVLGQKRDGEVPPTLLPDLDPDQPDTLAFTTESWCPVAGQTALPGRDAGEFLRNAVRFCNETLHGTLSGEVIIHPKVQKALGAAFEDALADLRYGAIGVNHWPALAFILGTTTWGAYPGHTLDDIQSGIGAVHNTLLFDRPQKSVIYGPFQPWYKPPWFLTHRRSHRVAARLVGMEEYPSLGRMPGILVNALRP